MCSSDLVSAKDMATSKEQKITISNSSGLSKDEVAKMVKDAESHAADDKTRRELIDVRNQGDALAYSVEKTLAENRAKVPADVAARAEAGIEELRSALKTEDAAKIRTATEALQKLSHTMAEQMYKQAQTPPAGDAGAGHAGGSADQDVREGEVVDGEVVGA